MPIQSNEQKILIPLLYDYYVFDYFRILVPKLVEAGYNIQIITFDDKVQNTYSKIVGENNCIKGPILLRFLNNRTYNLFYRFSLWFLAQKWISGLKKKYKFAIVPWDYRIIWYLISINIPSLTIHNTYNFVDIKLELENIFLPNDNLSTFPTNFFLYIEKKLNIHILPKAGNYFLKYDRNWIFDKFLGSKRINYLHAFSGISFLTVTGIKIKKNFQKLGVGINNSKTKIIVSGNPNYENLLSLKNNFTKADKVSFLQKLQIPFGKKVFTLFLSLSSFTKDQFQEIEIILECILKEIKDVWLVVKCHPKAKNSDIVRFNFLLKSKTSNFSLIKQFYGDNWNAKLVMCSFCLVQKQSTVGYLGFIFKIPVLSYNIYDTNYSDDLYKILGGSMHSESLKEFRKNLKLLFNKKAQNNLKINQEIACKNFFDIEKIPSK